MILLVGHFILAIQNRSYPYSFDTVFSFFLFNQFIPCFLFKLSQSLCLCFLAEYVILHLLLFVFECLSSLRKHILLALIQYSFWLYFFLWFIINNSIMSKTRQHHLPSLISYFLKSFLLFFRSTRLIYFFLGLSYSDLVSFWYRLWRLLRGLLFTFFVESRRHHASSLFSLFF